MMLSILRRMTRNVFLVLIATVALAPLNFGQTDQFEGVREIIRQKMAEHSLPSVAVAVALSAPSRA